jgi:hypothetical protein
VFDTFFLFWLGDPRVPAGKRRNATLGWGLARRLCGFRQIQTVKKKCIHFAKKVEKI